MLVLTGSRALELQCSSYVRQGRKSNIQDYDFICPKDDFKDLVKVLSSSLKLHELYFSDKTNKGVAKFKHSSRENVIIEASFIDVEGGLQESDAEIYHDVIGSCGGFEHNLKIGNQSYRVRVAGLPILYAMKHSHKYLKNSPHFEKTRQDIKVLNSIFLSQPPGGLFDAMLKRREKLTYSYNHPNLNQSKEGFFTDSVPYLYDHDSIHEAVKHLAQPAYKHYIKEGEEVLCDKGKWDALPDFIKLLGVLEESYVLALERSVIPHNTDPDKAFKMALEKVCTSITSGWFREYAYYNYDRVMELYSPCFVAKFQNALAGGYIKPYTGSNY